LVGGHCIGVDPYYLTYKAQSVGYEPEIILAGRRLNDAMSSHVSSRLISEMTKRNIQISGSKVLIMGLTFKENCPDIRNTKVIDVVKSLEESHIDVDIYDPWIDSVVATQNYKLNVIAEPKKGQYDAVIITVAHDIFIEKGIEFIKSLVKLEHLIFDVKYLFPEHQTDLRL
jgi:UDP-N-acetyl-D-galactosamine dehydrogenase